MGALPAISTLNLRKPHGSHAALAELVGGSGGGPGFSRSFIHFSVGEVYDRTSSDSGRFVRSIERTYTSSWHGHPLLRQDLLLFRSLDNGGCHSVCRAVFHQTLIHQGDDLVYRVGLEPLLLSDLPNQAIDPLDVSCTAEERTCCGRRFG